MLLVLRAGDDRFAKGFGGGDLDRLRWCVLLDEVKELGFASDFCCWLEGEVERLVAELVEAVGAPKGFLDGAPNEGVPNEGVPSEGVPNEGAPNVGAPKDGVADDGVPKGLEGLARKGFDTGATPLGCF